MTVESSEPPSTSAEAITSSDVTDHEAATAAATASHFDPEELEPDLCQVCWKLHQFGSGCIFESGFWIQIHCFLFGSGRVWIRIDLIRIRIQHFCSIRIRFRIRIQAKTELSKTISFSNFQIKSKIPVLFINIFSKK
jgi:hypothetical protein